jgi:hypothetical protein
MWDEQMARIRPQATNSHTADPHERLAILDVKLRGLNELRECTTIPELRKLLDTKLDEIGEAREALE